jgi:thiopeptide-type bacteriocin biosynthesis protein
MLTEPAHAAMLHTHLQRRGHAQLTEAPAEADYGWLDGHAHEIAVPLFTTGAPAPDPLTSSLPAVDNTTHGHLPHTSAATWLSVKVFTHPERHDELIAAQLPRLLDALDEPLWWFIRYRNDHETDHLRLRIRVSGEEERASWPGALGTWGVALREAGLAGRLTFDTYYPEVGRYGSGPAMRAAEQAFAADSAAAAAGLRHLPANLIHPTALTAVGMFDVAEGFLGGSGAAAQWLITRPVRDAPPAERAAHDQAVGIARRGVPAVWPESIGRRWAARRDALGAYRRALSPEHDADAVLASLLHVHHNRVRGIDRPGEATCRRVARQIALAWLANPDGLPR